MDSLDAQLASLEQSISLPVSNTIASSGSSSGTIISSITSKWGTAIRIIVSGILSAALLAGFRPIWIHSISYNGEDDAPQKKILWIRAAGAWVGITIVFFVLYQYVISKYVTFSR